ncbi:MAG: glycosyltransferase family 2 protein [Candidatus Sulfobium sp.]
MKSATPEKSRFLSVIISTYNRAELLKEALEALVKQTLSRDEFEVIVIDDGSADNTSEVAASFSDTLPLKYFHQNNAGLASARNHGIYTAQGKILLFLDDDDIATPGLLEEHVKTHRKYPKDNYAVLHHTAWSPEVSVTPVMHFMTDIGCFLFAYRYIKHGDILDYRNFWGGRTSCKRSFLIDHGVFNPAFRFGNEDTELGYRLSKQGLRIVYNANAVAYMTRPVDFDGFCRRLMKQGRSNFACSRMHDDPGVQEWCEVPGAAENWDNIRGRFGEIMRAARELDRIANLKLKSGFDLDEVTLRLLHQAYWEALRACKLKGFMEAAAAESSGSARRPVQRGSDDFRIIAIMCVYNEEDIIYHSLKHLIENGIFVYLMDHNSTDKTVDEASKWLGKGLLRIEKFPQESGFSEDFVNTFALRFITKRVEQLHGELDADWYMHYDVDEFREAPWPGMGLKEGIRIADSLGYNAIDFNVLNFRPTDDSYVAGDDVRKYLKYYELAEDFDSMQVKGWKNLGQTIDLASTAGHMVAFEGRRIFPVRFITMHFPIRSREHGLKKIFRDRIGRFDKKEKEIGWHLQYNSVSGDENSDGADFIYDRNALTLYDSDEVRKNLWFDAIAKLDSSRK